MDGPKRRVTFHSLRFQLSVWFSAALLLAAIAGGSFAFVSAQREANEFLDDQLRQVAALIDHYDVSVNKAAPLIREDLLNPDARVLVQILGTPHVPGGHLQKDLQMLPDNLPDGIQTRFVAGDYWRIFVYPMDVGTRLAVAQKTREREEIARNSAIHTVAPLIALIPIMGILIAIITHKILKPVTTLSAEVNARSLHDLTMLDDRDIPSEVQPLTHSINNLLLRVEKSVEMQRRFVADAAHELRTPLTALSLQAEEADDCELTAPAKERISALRAGLKRSRALLDQLLALARAQTPGPSPASRISMQAVVRRALEDLAPLADLRQIDVGVSGDFSDDDVYVFAREIDMISLVKNLLDNAIRYTPPEGCVDLRVFVEGRNVALEVTDSGPGIPPEERERVLDPFYRIAGNEEPGSGLGLSIVKNIVDRMDGTLSFSDANELSPSKGLRVLVLLEQHQH
jgi:two-component system OmpR family sensor kinase